MNIKIALAALLVTISSFVFADGINMVVGKNGIVPPPACFVNNIPVRYIAGSPAFLAQNNARVAAAVADPRTGMPAVFYSATELKVQKPEFQKWVFAHECAHWELGHLARPYHAGAREYEEEAADCRAAEILVEAGFSNEQLNTTLSEIQKEQDRRYQFVGDNLPPGMKKPLSGHSRATHARQCMDEAKARHAANLY